MSENSNEAIGFMIVMFRLVSKTDMVTGEGGCDWRDHLLDDPYCCRFCKSNRVGGKLNPAEYRNSGVRYKPTINSDDTNKLHHI